MNEGRGLGGIAAGVVYNLYLGQLFSMVIVGITFIFVTRLLGPALYGIYVFAFGFSSFIDAVGTFGIGSYFSKNIAHFSYAKDYKNIARTLLSGYSVLLPLAILLTLLGFLLSGYAANVLFRSVGISTLTLMLASSTILFIMMQYVSIQALVGFSRADLAAKTNIIVDLVQLFSSVILIHYGFGANGAVSGMLAGYIVGAVMAVGLVYKTSLKYGKTELRIPSKSDMLHAIRFSSPLAAISFLNVSVQNFAILLLGFYVSKATLGNFGAALTGLSFTAIAYNTMSTALLPIFSTANAARKSKAINATYNKILDYSLLLTLPLIIYIAVFAGPGLNLLVTKRYASAPLYLTLVALGTAVNVLGFYMSSMITSRGHTKKLLLGNLVSAISQIVSIVVLVPYIRVIGAIIGLFLVNGIVEDLLFIKISRDLLHARLQYSKILRIYLGNLLLAPPLALLLFLGNPLIELATGIIILLLAYPPIVGLLGVVEREDMGRINRIASGIPVLARPVRALTRYTALFIHAC